MRPVDLYLKAVRGERLSPEDQDAIFAATDSYTGAGELLGEGSFGEVTVLTNHELMNISKSLNEANPSVWELPYWGASPRDVIKTLEGGSLSAHAYMVGELAHEKLVLKTQDPCNGSDQVSRAICAENIEDVYEGKAPVSDILPRNKKGGYRKSAIVPTVMVEGVISGAINMLDTPHFTRMLLYAPYVSEDDDPHALSVLERIEPINERLSMFVAGTDDSNEEGDGRYNTYVFLFQIAHALWVAQRDTSFQHSDMHFQNVGLVKVSKREVTYHFSSERDEYSLKLTDVRLYAKIFDFGTASIDLPEGKGRIVARASYSALYKKGLFHPLYDLAMYMGTLVAPVLWGEIGIGMREYFFLFGKCFDIDTEKWQVELSSDKNVWGDFVKTYFPNGVPTAQFFKDSHASDLTTALRHLASMLVRIRDSGSLVKTEPDFVKTGPSWNVFLLDEEFGESADLPVSYRAGYVTNEIFSLLLKRPKGRQSTKVHMFEINVGKPGFEFRTECCRADTIELAIGEGGLVINGGFFDLTRYLPVGSYRQSGEDIDTGDGEQDSGSLLYPSIYKDYAVYVPIRNGMIRVPQKERPDDSDFFVAGPMLLKDGEIVFTRHLASEEERKAGRPLFSCSQRNDLRTDGRVYGKENGTWIPSCTDIRPGELSHATDKNPRSMLVYAVKDGKEYIHFIVADGDRNALTGKPSPGLSLFDMAKLAKKIKGARIAVSLDGGSSSNIAVRFPGSDVVESTSHVLSYPSGNALLFTKK